MARFAEHYLDPKGKLKKHEIVYQVWEDVITNMIISFLEMGIEIIQTAVIGRIIDVNFKRIDSNDRAWTSVFPLLPCRRCVLAYHISDARCRADLQICPPR